MNHPACPIPKPVAQNPKTTNNGSNPNNNKPKRPLSAFNLFYRYKRRKILRYISRGGGGGVDKDEIIRIVGTAPGLEAEGGGGGSMLLLLLLLLLLPERPTRRGR